MSVLRFLLFALLLCPSVSLVGCDSSGWTNPPGDDDTIGDDDDSIGDDDDSIGDDDDSAGDDDDSAGDDDDSAGDDDDSAGDDDDSIGDDDDSTPNANDSDGDGYDSIASGGDDCNDSDSSVNPGAIEDPANGVDDDCDSITDETMDATGFSPSDGLALGGTVVTVTGTGLTAVTGAWFGAPAAASVTVIDDTTVEVVSPAAAVGDVDLIIGAAVGNVTFAQGFRYTGECTDSAACLDSAVLPTQQQPSTTLGVESESFSAVMTDSAIADCSAPPAGVIAQVGLGQQSANPLPNVDPSWQWFAASFDAAASSTSECAYTGSITHDSYGSFWVTFRFSDDGGYNWVYADSDAGTPLDYLEMSQLHVTP